MSDTSSTPIGMSIGQMHVMFRQFAQQMGMQNIRAILPEQIDLLLNTSIGDVTNQIVRSSVAVTNDRIITDNSKIQQINSLRTLYKTDRVRITPENCFTFSNSDYLSGRFKVNLDAYEVVTPYSPATPAVLADPSDPDSEVLVPATPEVKEVRRRIFSDYLFLVDFSVNYTQAAAQSEYGELLNGWYSELSGNRDTHAPQAIKDSEFISNIYPVRLIDDAFLADTLNDFLLKPTLRSPVITIVNNDCEIYFGKMTRIGEFGGGDGYVLRNALTPYELRVSYIAKPALVHYGEDIRENDVHCDLPANLHIDVVKHAVELYSQIIGRGVNPQEGTSQVNTGESTTPQQRQ